MSIEIEKIGDESAGVGDESVAVSDQLLRGTTWMTLANVIARIGTFVANLIVIRMLGLQLLGQLGLIESWLSLASMFSVFGLASASTRFIARHLNNDLTRTGEYAGASILLSGGFAAAVCGVVLVGLHVIPAKQFGSGDDSLIASTLLLLKDNSLLVVGLLFVTTLNEVGVGIVQGLHQFKSLIYLNLVAGLLSVPLYFALTHFFGVSGVLTARFILLSIQVVIAVAVSQLALRRLATRFSARNIIANGQSLILFAVPTFVSQLIANPARTLMTTYLASVTGGAIQVGLLTTAGRLLSLATFLPGSMGSVVLPVLSAVWGRGESDGFQQAVLFSSRVMWFVTLPVVIFFVAATPVLLGGLYGPEFTAAAAVTILMLANTLLTSINDTGVRALAAANRQWLTVAMVTGSMIISVVVSLWAVPALQAIGYALALLISTLAFLAALLIVFDKLYQVRISQVVAILGISVPVFVLAVLIARVQIGMLQLVLASAATAITLVIIWYRMMSWQEKQTFRRFGALLAVRLRHLTNGRKGAQTVS
jgi:O-antigen/teichoic acid export membrane protein